MKSIDWPEEMDRLRVLEAALAEWRATWQTMLYASEAYNARLAVVRAERERGNWSASVDPEYQTLEITKRALFPAHEKLFAALATVTPKGK